MSGDGGGSGPRGQVRRGRQAPGTFHMASSVLISSFRSVGRTGLGFRVRTLELSARGQSRLDRQRYGGEALNKQVEQYEKMIQVRKKQIEDLRQLMKGIQQEKKSVSENPTKVGKKRKLDPQERNDLLSNKLLQLLEQHFPLGDASGGSFWEEFIKHPQTVSVDKELLLSKGISTLITCGLCKSGEYDKATKRTKLEIM